MGQLSRCSFRRFGLLTCALVAGLVSASASAAEDGWGTQGRVLLTGALAVQNASAGGSSVTELAVTPGIRYFAANHLAVGVEFQLVHISSGSGVTAFGIQPSLGYDVLLSEQVSLVPQLELLMQLQSGGSSTQTRFAVGGFLPILVHPPGHFFIGFGPEVMADVSSDYSQKMTTIGARSVLGAWF
jgi:hypothetical protein